LQPISDARQLTASAQEASAALGRSCATEIAGLPSDARLVDANRYAVYCTRANEIPRTLAEIGRLRAVAFRAAGEGTGADVDLDAFDPEYRHLFAWDRVAKRIVGAYRIGVVSEIVGRRGVAGLYTRTLFDYGTRLLDAFGPALELGRSFVSVDYQRNHQALLLLWRGIGAFVARHPEHRVLFGPVSISARYCDASHALLAAFLEQNHLDPSLASMVRPKRPPLRTSAHDGAVPIDTDQADRRIRQIESDGKPMPVLLRQYLKLHARALGFSVDPGFGHVLDALMAVNLAEVPPHVLRRYLGSQAA
jgi:putative hemolysin